MPEIYESAYEDALAPNYRCCRRGDGSAQPVSVTLAQILKQEAERDFLPGRNILGQQKLQLKKLQEAILTMAYNGGEGHLPSSLSILDLVQVIHEDEFVSLHNDSQFVLSKGHGCLALYAVLAAQGYFPEAWLAEFTQFDSPLGGHPDSSLVPGVVASTGSLGHGFPMAIGMAYALRMSDAYARVYVLIGDGESNEGAVWEAALAAAHHNLSNIVCIVDANGSSTRAIEMGSIGSKFASFGWTVSEVDGHNQSEIRAALRTRRTSPFALIARTIKGKGLSEMEDNPAWHHKRLSKYDYERFVEEIQ